MGAQPQIRISVIALALASATGAQTASPRPVEPERHHFDSFDCGRAGRQEVRIRARPVGADRHVAIGVRNPPCPVRMWVNGRLLGEARATAFFDVADEFRQPAMNRVELERLAEGTGGLEVFLHSTPRVYIERAGPVRLAGGKVHIPVTVRNTLDNTADIYIEVSYGGGKESRNDNLPPGAARSYEWNLTVDPGAADVTVRLEKLAEALEGAYTYSVRAEYAESGN